MTKESCMTSVATPLNERIRLRAYHLWEADGRPAGRDVEFWERARALIAIEDNPTAGQLPNPMQNSPSPEATQRVEPIEAVENLGEFPNRFIDQGNRPQAPRRRRKKA
jgi:Protein of unknown function (DUF2934)